MEIITTDGKRYVDVGSKKYWDSLFSTIIINLEKTKNDIMLAVKFIETGACSFNESQETARQINLIRDRLSQFGPDKAVYDYHHPEMKCPWEGNLSPIVTSCGNLYTTSDGKDLLVELVTILTYSSVKKVNVEVSE